MKDDVEEFYTNSISNQSRCTSRFSGLKGVGYLAEVSGIGLVSGYIGYWMDPLPILYQTALLKLVFFVQVLKKIALPFGASSKF